MKLPRTFIPVFLILFTISLLLNLYFIYQQYNNSRVTEVIDGDTFKLQDGRRIRLLSVDAPEKGRCLSIAAKNRLDQLILHKRVRLEDIKSDNFDRTLANVHLGNRFINLILLEEGLVKFTYVSSSQYDVLKQTAQRAKANKTGIYSSECRSIQSTTECLIKGNVDTEGSKIYHLPDCTHYPEVIIDTAFGDQWFCTEQEAIQSGFKKAAGCP